MSTRVLSDTLIIYFTAIPALLLIVCVYAWAKSKCIENKAKKRISTLLKSAEQQQPWLAQALADIGFISDNEIATELRTKKHPARKAADEVSKIAAEKRDLTKQLKVLQYQIQFLETLYPWLSDFKDISIEEAFSYSGKEDSEYNAISKWLSPAEYNKLSESKKNQLALDRWIARNKNAWEAGRDYERYIGYIYETNGWQVDYVGAVRGKEDRGIDLIVKRGSEINIIQCKRYSAVANKYVHENTVAQIFGVAALYSMENHVKAIPVIVSSSSLSTEAKHFAEYLNVCVSDNIPLKDYPLIKCNKSSKGELIYHLPFDQQYDKIKISGKKGAMYVSTVKEAEKLGYRHAYKWKGDNF